MAMLIERIPIFLRHDARCTPPENRLYEGIGDYGLPEIGVELEYVGYIHGTSQKADLSLSCRLRTINCAL